MTNDRMPQAARMAIMMAIGKTMLGAFSESMCDGNPVGVYGWIVLGIGGCAMGRLLG